MNIVYIDHYAGSPEMGMEFRPYYLAREWVKMGHSVWIVAGDYSHLRLKNPRIKEDFTEQVIDGITYVWLRTGEYEGNGSERALTMFRLVGKLRKRAKRIAEEWRPDVIITSSTYPLDTYAGQKIRSCCRKIGIQATLIHEIHDMWPITLTEIGGMSKANPFVMMMQKAENSFCRNSDYIVSLLCAADTYLEKHGMAPEKFRPILNGVVMEEWEDPEPLPAEHQTLLDRLHAEGKTVICYFGSVNPAYSIDYLIRAKQIVSDPDVAIVIVGEGYQKDELMQMQAEDVYFLPRIPKATIPSLMENIDCCYVGGVKNSIFRFGICMNKLFDSMMSGHPILYAVEAPNNLIRDFDCGISVAAEDDEALADGIRQLMAMPQSERERLGKNGKQAIWDHFSYEKLAETFAEVFQ